MTRFIPTWPTLLIWAALSVAVYMLGVGFGGSLFAPFVAPPPNEDFVAFVLWLAVLCLVFAPFLLMVARIVMVSRDRGDHVED
jgi:hypothetical protein